MFWEDEIKVLGVVDGVEDGQDGTTGITDYDGVLVDSSAARKDMQLTDMLHSLPQHHLVEDLSSSLANKPVLMYC